MWEWLRRDPGYIAWYARASEVTRGVDALPRGALAWGLHFRRGSGDRRPPGAADLACRSRSRHVGGRGPARRAG
ncbi:transcriptional regulator domain-containing protein [Sphingomonas pruni]|uniref:transcriptional regulator domain-containing protein n=1 Tax=Sphingomonas pruni TaxID=40683 RepID=UPI0034E24DC8